MSEAPSMPVFIDAYLADTTHLSTEEHGAYLLLLMAMWRRNGSVPNDDKDIARIVGLSIRKWLAVKARLLPLLDVDGTVLTQKRLRKEWVYVQEKREKNAQNGTRGGRPKSNINNRLDKANGYQNENPNESPHNPEPIPKEKPSGFSARGGAKKTKGWIDPKTPLDAANNIIRRIRENEQQGTGRSDEIAGGPVLQLSAVGRR